MIGSLICYGLYPLTKLISALSDFWWNRHPLCINGNTWWNCGGENPSRKLNDQQTSQEDRLCSTAAELSETLQPVQQEDSGSLLELRELERNHQWEMDLKEAPQEDMKKSCTLHHVGESADDVKIASSVISAGHSSSSSTPGFSVAKHTTPGNKQNAKDAENPEMEMLKERHIYTHGNPSFKKRDHVKESDPYSVAVNTTGHEVSVGAESVYDLSTLLANDTKPLFPSEPIGWHFPVGLGPSEFVHCPIGTVPHIKHQHMFYKPEKFQVTWRVWEDLSQQSHCPSSALSKTPFDFTVMSYNILAQDLLEANFDLYPYCSEDALVWENRLCTILTELQTWRPDIICLQEVQKNHFEEEINPALTELGYKCVYKRRTGNKTDGCAVCYLTERFSQLSVSLIEFRRQDIELLDRDNVAIVLLLQPIAASCEDLTFRPICVANTHLLFNPRRGDVKLAQLAIVLAEIHSIVKKCQAKGHDCEIILCGDLNSLPNTPLYQLICTGQLYYHGLPTWMVSGQEDLSYKTYHKHLYAPLWPCSLGIDDNCQYSEVSESYVKESRKLQYNHDFLQQLRYCPAACVRPPDLELIPGVTDIKPTPVDQRTVAPRCFSNTISHRLNLSSVYSQSVHTGYNVVTTLHKDGAAMVDYIFYSTQMGSKDGGLKLLGRLALLTEADLWPLNGLPNQIFPSDHLSLLAKFRL